MDGKKQLDLEPRVGDEKNIGQWLAALQDTRNRTMTVLTGMKPGWLNFIPDDEEESISTILYHLAAIEASWLYEEVLQASFPPEVDVIFPYDVRDEEGKLSPVAESLESHLERLKMIRGKLLEVFSEMTEEEFVSKKQLEDYDVSPVYMLHHLMQHEAEHRSQMDRIGMKAKAAPDARMPKENE